MTLAVVLAVQAVHPPRTHPVLAPGPPEAWLAQAGPVHVVAARPVGTVTGALAAWAVRAHRAFLVASEGGQISPLPHDTTGRGYLVRLSCRTADLNWPKMMPLYIKLPAE